MAQASERSGLTLAWVLQRVAVAIVVAMALALPRSASADVVAVIAGIDDYEHVSKLGGAVFDAEDLAASFTWLGARTALLLERDVTRDDLLATLDDALATAASGDVMVFS